MNTVSQRAQRQGVFYMLLCAAMWSIAGIFIKLIPWNSFAIAGWRSLISALCVLTYMKKSHLSFCASRMAVLNGAVLALTFLCFISANKLTTSANAIMLQYVSPVFILFLSAKVFHQRVYRSDLLVTGFTLAGIALFFLDQLSPGNLLGNMIALFSGFTMASVFMTSSQCKSDDERMTGILLGHVFTALVGIPTCFFTPTPSTVQAVGCILVLGIVQLGIPYVLYGLAVRSCPPLLCSLLGTVEPLLNPVWVFLGTGEAPGPFALAGCCVVLVTITAWMVYKSRRAAA